MPVGVPRDGRPERRTTLAGWSERRCAVRVAQLTPRLRATANASFVRFEIASRSACATSATIPTVRCLPRADRPRRTSHRCRAASAGTPRCTTARSSLAITSVAPVTLARCSAAAWAIRVPPALHAWLKVAPRFRPFSDLDDIVLAPKHTQAIRSRSPSLARPSAFARMPWHAGGASVSAH
jgi:hypothetical protein